MIYTKVNIPADSEKSGRKTEPLASVSRTLCTKTFVFHADKHACRTTPPPSDKTPEAREAPSEVPPETPPGNAAPCAGNCHRRPASKRLFRSTGRAASVSAHTFVRAASAVFGKSRFACGVVSCFVFVRLHRDRPQALPGDDGCQRGGIGRLPETPQATLYAAENVPERRGNRRYKCVRIARKRSNLLPKIPCRGDCTSRNGNALIRLARLSDGA